MNNVEILDLFISMLKTYHYPLCLFISSHSVMSQYVLPHDKIYLFSPFGSRLYTCFTQVPSTFQTLSRRSTQVPFDRSSPLSFLFKKFLIFLCVQRSLLVHTPTHRPSGLIRPGTSNTTHETQSNDTNTTLRQSSKQNFSSIIYPTIFVDESIYYPVFHFNGGLSSKLCLRVILIKIQQTKSNEYCEGMSTHLS